MLLLTCYTLSNHPQTSPSDQGIDFWHPQGSGKTHIHQMGHWSIMSDRPSYTIHPQPSGVTGSSCMDFCSERLDCQITIDESEASLNFEGIEPTDYLTHQSDTTAELNIQVLWWLARCIHNLFRCRSCSKDRCIQCTTFLPYGPLIVTLMVNCMEVENQISC